MDGEDVVRCPYGCLVPSLIPGRGPRAAPADPVYETDPPGGDRPLPTGEFRCTSCRRVFTPSGVFRDG